MEVTDPTTGAIISLPDAQLATSEFVFAGSSLVGQADEILNAGIREGGELHTGHAPFTSNFVAIVGASFGDEGKGRTIKDAKDLLVQMTGDAEPVAMVVKINGGANSGHTVDGLKHNLIPGGVTDISIKHLALGRGVVADPFKLEWEVRALEKMFGAQGRDIPVSERIVLDNRLMFSDFTDRLLDIGKEMYRVARGGEKRGSTAKGVTPAFNNETNQEQIWYEVFQEGIDSDGDIAAAAKEQFSRMMQNRIDNCCGQIKSWVEKHKGVELPEDMKLGATLRERTWYKLFAKLRRNDVKAHQEGIDAGYFTKDDFDVKQYLTRNPFEINAKALIDAYWEKGCALARQLKIDDVGEMALDARAQGKYVFGEFGQSYWLHMRHGYSPNVTASRTYTGEFFESVNVPVGPIHTIAVVKAYKTAVGTHHFPTQLNQDDGIEGVLYKTLAPAEFGTTTGRQRMIGWFDAVEVGHVLRRGGFQDLVINKLDALTYHDQWQEGQLKVCVGYRTPKGQIIHHMPTSDRRRKLLEPVYKTFDGWSEDISKVRSWEDLPQNAKVYVAAMYKAIIDAAYYKGDRPAELPTFRFVGVGAKPEQIISDVPNGNVLYRFAAEAELQTAA